MEDAVWQKVQAQYKRGGCSTQNEFIAKAILFYCGYLQSEYAGDFLPKILSEMLEAILSMFGDRIGKLLLKQAVEQNTCNHILASDTDIDAATYARSLRRGIHAPHLHPRHTADAGKCSQKDGQFHGAGYVKKRRKNMERRRG